MSTVVLYLIVLAWGLGSFAWGVTVGASGQLVKRALDRWWQNDRLDGVEALIEQAKKVSPSDRMTVYVGDLEHALGLRDEPARTRTGSNE